MDFTLSFCLFLIRCFIPLTLGTAVVLRPNLFSLIYLILLFVAPILPSPNSCNVCQGVIGKYLKTIIFISAIINSMHVLFQGVLLVLAKYNITYSYCSLTGQILNSVGLHRYNDLSIWNILRLGFLDITILLIVCCVYVFALRTFSNVKDTSRENLTKSETKRTERERRLTEAGFSIESLTSQLGPKLYERQYLWNKKRLMKEKALKWTYYFSEAIFCTLLCISSILEPSLISSVYFLYFLFIGSWYALNRSFGMGYHYFRIFITFFVASHLSLLFVYQFLIVKPVIPPGNINARLFGLIEYINTTCSNSREYDFNTLHFVRFLHPFVLILLYFVSVNLIRSVLITKKYYWLIEDRPSKYGYVAIGDHRSLDDGHGSKLTESVHMNTVFDSNATIHTPLLSNRRASKTYNTSNNRNLSEDMTRPRGESMTNPQSSGMSACPSPSVPNTPNQMCQSGSQQPESEFATFISLAINMITRGSYVITLIVMMTWSITYHSWLSFALLLASCIIWMTPNSRQACLNSSPVVVFYAILLLIGQYIYSLNLTDQELPVIAGQISISEIGFKKYGEFSYQPLAIKIFYTLFFWITLKQYSRNVEQSQELNASVEKADQTTIPPAPSKNIDWIKNRLHGALIKYWIWVVATTLMIMSLSGSRVVIYRIVYMFLFLTFVLMFQLSLKWWRKFLYPFWLTVILYSMIILIAIYTYQFDNFPDYWQDYLFIDKDLQEDLGLVVFDNDAFVLFKELLTPTFFIIITIIQVHFVHKDFLEISDINNMMNRLENNNEYSSSEQGNTSPSKSSSDHVKIDVEDLKSQPSQSEISSFQTVISKKAFKALENESNEKYVGERSMSPASNISKLDSPKLSFFEEMKIVTQRCCGYMQRIGKKCLVVFWRLAEIHILKLVFLCAMIISIKDISVMNVVFVFMSVFLMVFNQFENITSFILGTWAGILVLLKMLFQLNIAQQIDWQTDCNNGSIIDNRIYIGFLKTDDIVAYTWEYIFLIVILVFRSVINLRQYIYRNRNFGITLVLEGVVFPEITRELADKDFVHFLKYMTNYCFYKFGMEIVLILLTISIGNRSDIFSVFYCLWLLVFVLYERKTNEKIWTYFVGFMAILMPYQYLMCLGLPPGLCYEYPWTGKIQPTVQEWYFLPDFQYRLPKEKLYLDFIILYFACRQLLYLRLTASLDPKAGSNIEAHLERINYRVPDFFSFGTSIFDSIKSFFFLCFFWITLAILFLAGTTRINLFGLGYVLGSFIFLWNGNEFYLKPITWIFKLWKLIIAYTCITMLFKSVIQFFVIIMLRNGLCWLIQLLGLSLYDKALLYQDDLNLANQCSMDDAGFLWDGICFTFLLIQKRIFCSHYFKHLIREIKAQHFLASRGAELIHEIQAQEVSEQKIAETDVMEKIKQKMDRIKEAQQKMFANQARSIKSHKQDEFDYDISPYSGADETLSNGSVSEDFISQTLPTVYSPTPSIPTISSPQSATSIQPGYFEVYRVCPIRPIDASSSSATFPSFSFAAPTTDPGQSPQSFKINVPILKDTLQLKHIDDPKSEDASSPPHSSAKTLISCRQKEGVVHPPVSRKQSHASSVKSGGYYMFEDLDTDEVDLEHKHRASLIPDPEGNEIRNLAKSKGFTAFCSRLFKGEDVSDAAIVSAEATDVGESSKDSPIISVERPKYHPDDSKPTATTSLPSTSQDTDISNMSTLASKSSRKLSAPETESKKKSLEKSVQQEDVEYLDDEDEVPEKTYMEKITDWLKFIKTFLESILISATSNLNSVSRDYRFVAKRLSVEKKCLKKILEVKESESVTDLGSDQPWLKNTLKWMSNLSETDLENMAKTDPANVRIAVQLLKDGDKGCGEGKRNLYHVSLDPKYLETNILIHFFRAIFYAVLSRSEVMCYITIVINQIASASILSLPLPLFAFLWGSLSVPRPSKSFWVTSITYIEVMVVIKYIFQFQFYPWLVVVRISPFWWPRLIGIERKDNYANYDLILLLVLFFHRFMLKSLGLWDLSETEMKAYTFNIECDESDHESRENSLENKNRNSGKKKLKSSKSKADMSKDKAQGDLNQADDGAGSLKEDIPLEVALLEEDLLMDVEDEDEGSEFNMIYFMMKTPTKAKKKFFSIVNPVTQFFHNVLNPPYRITHDVYSLMFLCDFINFFILVFGFYSFGSGYSGSADVARFLEENRIPIGFLIILLIQFAQIIVDRAIYLRKYIKGKLIFQIILVIFIHMWLFFVLPAMTEKSFTDKSNLPPKLWYIFKCIYFLLSAYQIRSGYPTRILGNTFCKKYNLINWYLFKMYMLIPFVYDLRMYMDWIWTDTSLVLDEWSLMEDIFVNLYQRKCELKLDEEFPEPRGKPKKRFFKYLIGGSWVIIIIALIWGPLGLFAFGRTVGEVNPPIGATFELEIGGYQPLFKMSVTGSGMVPMGDRTWDELQKTYSKDAIAQTFINGYDQQDVYIVNLNGNSTAVWGISPPSQQILEQELNSNHTLMMKITYYITRKKQTKTQDMDTTIYDEHLIELNPVTDRNMRQQLANMISQQNEQPPVIIGNIFPNYLRVPEKGKPTYVTELLPKDIETNKSMNFRNMEILLKKGSYESGPRTSWWVVHDDCGNLKNLDSFFRYLIQAENCQYLPVVLFNDKVFIGLLAVLSGYGIIGIYTTFVFLVSRWVRGLNSESSFKVIYTRMPNVDRVLQLCLDIYLVRESREFELEEDLYAKLIFLYRSPETLIKWTKINEELSGPNQNVFLTN